MSASPPPEVYRRRRLAAGLILLVVVALAATVAGAFSSGSSTPPGLGDSSVPAGAVAPGPGGRLNVYAAAGAGMLSAAVAGVPERVYVPNTMSNTVTEIDPHALRVIRTIPVGELPQHVTPSYDLKTLYVDNDLGNSLTPLDPVSGLRRGPDIAVADPYNLYFTPDGRYAIVVTEQLKALYFRDAQTMRLHHILHVPGCPGVDHMDFSADGRYLYASCEFGSAMIEVDVARQKLIKTLHLPDASASPQDVKLSPDGRTLYSADQATGGVWEIDPRSFKVIGLLHTGSGAHGLYPSRDARRLYVTNRTAGTISVLSFATRRPVAKWHIPGPASPDMGGVSSDGRTLWLSGRYNAEVYAIDTTTGHLRARIPVGLGPHGLCVWPQPGRYSLGHTGILR